MDIDTGKIYCVGEGDDKNVQYISPEEFSVIENRLVRIDKRDFETLIKMHPEMRKNWMKNKPCPCGSGKKFKKCCWGNKGDKFNVAA